MIIALDYDGTVTADPVLWSAFVRLAHAQGHRVYVVTMRYTSEQQPVLDWLYSGRCSDVPIVCTGRKAKRPFCVNVVGVEVDVWIDDNPRAVHEDADRIWGGHLPEGKAPT